MATSMRRPALIRATLSCSKQVISRMGMVVILEVVFISALD